MTHKTLVIDLDRCIGCFACEMACKQENNVPLGVHYNKVLSIGPMGKFPDLTQYFLPTVCQHCKDAPCVKVCPTGATYQTEDGQVLVNKEKCIGCKMCMAACPYGARSYNPEAKVVEKCTLCQQRTAQGELPQCVAQCGARARFFGDLEQGIDTFEAPAVGYDVDRSYDNLYTGNRVTLGELAVEYGDADVHHLPDVGNGPHFAYILRDREWKGGE